MRSFKDYQKEAADVAAAQENVTQEETATAEELTQKIAAAYNGRRNMDMLKNILIEAEKSKRAGTLSNADLEEFYETFSPMLDGFQLGALRAIVNKLKEIE